MTDLEAELNMTVEQFRLMDAEERKAKSDSLTAEQIKQWNQFMRDVVENEHWQQRLDGTYPMDVESRARLIQEIEEYKIYEGTSDADRNGFIVNMGMLFEDYICTYPINTSMFNPKQTTALGAYGGILNFGLLGKAIDEILEVAFDKFGFMLEYVQMFDYLSPTFGMISGTMRRKMPEYQQST
jgi:phage-related minor tail protein